MSLWVQRMWDRLSLYFPLALMGGLALLTFWMMKNAPMFLPAPQPAQVLHEPDYSMRTFSVKTFDDTGWLKSEVFGAAARHFPDTDTTEIDQISIRMMNKQGQVITAVANQAIANGDGSELQLFGNAQVVREVNAKLTGVRGARISFQGEFLHVFMKTNKERITSHLPVALQKGRDEFKADSMDFDNLTQVLWLRGNVQGQLINAADAPS